jgi:hypothetical protein
LLHYIHTYTYYIHTHTHTNTSLFTQARIIDFSVYIQADENLAIKLTG